MGGVSIETWGFPDRERAWQKKGGTFGNDWGKSGGGRGGEVRNGGKNAPKTFGG